MRTKLPSTGRTAANRNIWGSLLSFQHPFYRFHWSSQFKTIKTLIIFSATDLPALSSAARPFTIRQYSPPPPRPFGQEAAPPGDLVPRGSRISRMDSGNPRHPRNPVRQHRQPKPMN